MSFYAMFDPLILALVAVVGLLAHLLYRGHGARSERWAATGRLTQALALAAGMVLSVETLLTMHDPSYAGLGLRRAILVVFYGALVNIGTLVYARFAGSPRTKALGQ